MGGEQQEDHVVHDVFIAQGQLAFFIHGAAQFGEEIGAIAGTLLRNQVGHELLEEAPALHAAIPGGAGNLDPQHRQRGIDFGNERLIDLLGLRAHFQAEEGFRANIEQQRLDRLEETELSAGWPTGETAGDMRVHAGHVAG